MGPLQRAGEGELPSPSSHSTKSKPTTLFLLVKQSQPIQFLIFSALFVLGYLYWPQRSFVLSSQSRAVLAGPGWEAARDERVSGRLPSQNRGKAVDNFSNPYGLIGMIDSKLDRAFNPSLLVLPDAVGERWRRLLVTRGPQPYEIINGDEVFWSTVYG